MGTLELWLAFISRLQTAAGFVEGIALLGTLLCSWILVASRIDGNENTAKIMYKWFRGFLILLIVVAPVQLWPSMDDVWKVRIALIKLQLASPDNIRKGSETIERIATQLECKYVGTNCPNSSVNK